MKTLFQSWGAKKNQKPKAVAKEIEDALSWWRNKKFSVDSKGLGPSDEAKMMKLESLIQKWADVKASNESPSDLQWLRNKNFSDIKDSFEEYEPEPEAPKAVEAPLFAGVVTDEQKRANEMSSALDWLRNNDAELDVDDELSVALSVATFKKIDSLMPKSGDSDEAPNLGSALDWLDDETVNSFKKIDNVLTKTGLRTSIQESGFGGALDWLRKRQAEKAMAAMGYNQ
jgi:hypothetical protein